MINSVYINELVQKDIDFVDRGSCLVEFNFWTTLLLNRDLNLIILILKNQVHVVVKSSFSSDRGLQQMNIEY